MPVTLAFTGGAQEIRWQLEALFGFKLPDETANVGDKLAEVLNAGPAIPDEVVTDANDANVNAEAEKAAKRTRRTKAEMEAARAAEQATPEPAKLSVVPTEPPPEAAPEADPFADAPAPATEAETRTALQVLMAKKGMPALVGLLAQFGAAKVSEIKPDQYGLIVDAANKLLAA